MKKSGYIPIVIVGLGAILAGGVFIYGNNYDLNSQIASRPVWTETTGEGIAAPACGSSSASAPTCVGSLPSVTFFWDVDTSGPYYPPDAVRLVIEPGGFNQIICGNGSAQSCTQLSGSWTGTGGPSNTLFNWWMYQEHFGSTNALIGSG